jgi:hypothetical protein
VSSPYGPILTGVGLLQNGKLSDAARAKYVSEVLALLATGNGNGKGGSPSTKIFNSLVALPPTAGPSIFNVTTLKSEPLFWFDPDPLAAMRATLLVDKTKTPIWNAIFPDLLYTSTAEALDANGSTPLFPLFDVSVAFPNLKGFPIALPDLAVESNVLPPPQLLIKLASLGIQLSIPTPPIPPIPPALPNFMPPALPGVTLPGLPALALPNLLIGLIKLPFDLIVQLVAPPSVSLVIDLISFKFDAVVNLAMNIIVELLADLIQALPKLLIASILIYVKDVVAMVCTVLVGLLTGAGGALTKSVAAATGLI